MHTGFWWRNLREGYYLEDPGIDGRTSRGGMGEHGLD